MRHTAFLAFCLISIAPHLTNSASAQPPSADFYWIQDLNHSLHYAYSIAQVTIDEHDYQNHTGSGYLMAYLDDYMNLTSGNQAASGAAVTFDGNGITDAQCDSEANVWATGNNTQTIFTQWTVQGGGYVETTDLPDYPDIYDEHAYASNFGTVQFDDRWNLARTNSSSGVAYVHGSFDINRTNFVSAWYQSGFKVQVGRDLDENGDPQVWDTVLNVGNALGENIGVEWYQWDEDEFGSYLAYQTDTLDYGDGPFEFDFSISTSQILRVVGRTDYALDVRADDNSTNSDDHYMTVSLGLTVLDP